MWKPTDFVAGLVAVAIMVAAVISPVFAQDVVAVAPGETVVSVAPWYDMIVAGITVIVGAVVTVAITVLGSLAKKFFNIQIDDKLKQTLHSAAVTGITSALQRYGANLRDTTIDVRSPIVAEAVRWVATTGAPSAVEKWGLSEEDIAKLILSKIKLLETGNANLLLPNGKTPEGVAGPTT